MAERSGSGAQPTSEKDMGLSTRPHDSVVPPEALPTLGIYALVADALTKLRAARLAEAETLSALVTVLVDIGTRMSHRLGSQVGTATGASAPVQTRELYLSVRQLAERVPYAEHTIRNLMATGALREGEHYYKRRGRVMFSWPAMCRWIEERKSLAAETLPMVRSRRRGG